MPSAPDTVLVSAQLANHEVGDAATRRRGVRGRTRARRAGPRGRVRGDRSRPALVRRARRRPLFGDRAQVGRTERRRRDARAPGPARATACSSAARRSGPGGAGSRTFPRGWASAPPRPTSTSPPRPGASASSSHARRRSSTRFPTSCGSAIHHRRFAPAPPVHRCGGCRGGTDPAGVGSARSRRALGVVVLVGDAGTVARARGDGRRRRSFAAGVGRLVDDRGRRRPLRRRVAGNRRTDQGVASVMTVRRLNHAVLYVRDAADRCRVLPGGARLRGGRRSRRRRRRVPARPPAPTTTTTSGCSRSARKHRSRSGAASGCTTSPGRSTRSTTSRRCANGSHASVRSSARATTA